VNAARPAVEVDHLLKRFGSFVAVDNVSFSVDAGEIFGFVGSNGAGKTTTIRMLCGLLTRTGGRAVVGGHDIAVEPERVKDNIGYMSQKFSLYDDLSVGENIEFYSGIYGVSADRRSQRRDDVLRLAGLEGRRQTMTGVLGGGLKQRLALGCAILHEPPILFLDEPTSGVDPVARREFWDVIYALSGEGHTVFVSTHYMDEAEYCHRLALMHRGRIIGLGTPDELKRQWRARTLMHLESSNLRGSMRVLEEVEGVRATAVYGAGLHLTVDHMDRAAGIRSALDSAGIEIRRLEAIRPSMEDVFVGMIEDDEARVP
jgi:ABC-2 type transport system ATP-binding protein